MHRILFVDDEINILSSLKRGLRCRRDVWDMHFVSSGQEALDLLAAEPFDTIVSDVRMPEMDGVELMHHIVEKYPDMVRIIVSGYSDQEFVLKSSSLVHQFLPKPCDMDVLIASIENGQDFFDLMEQPALKSIIKRLKTLPSLPNLYFELMAAASAADSSSNTIARIIGQDLGMSAKMLQIANSAVFGNAGKINTPNKAVVFLGFDIIKALALSLHVFSIFEPKNLPRFDLAGIWRSSMAIASIGKKIAEYERLPRGDVDKVFMSGLMHDVGRLLLASNLTDQYRTVLETVCAGELSLCEAEQQVFGVTHAEVGAYLLGLWGFPRDAVLATAMHHKAEPVEEGGINIVACLYFANLLNEFVAGDREELELTPSDQAYLDALGVQDHLDDWLALLQIPVDDSD